MQSEHCVDICSQNNAYMYLFLTNISINHQNSESERSSRLKEMSVSTGYMPILCDENT